MCLNGTHPYLLAEIKPFQIVQVKLAVGNVYGQWTESTTRAGLSRIKLSAKNRGFCKQNGDIANLHTLLVAGQNSSCFGNTLLTYMRK